MFPGNKRKNVQNIFYQGNKRKQEKLESFFNCAATLMTENLQLLTLLSLKDYQDLIVQPPFEPTFNDFEVILLNASQVVPRSDNDEDADDVDDDANFKNNDNNIAKYCKELSESDATLKPVILEDILERHKVAVRELIKQESIGPIEHSKIYDKYNFLISKQVCNDDDNDDDDDDDDD
ncbi:hypothetical protein DPMN_184681 [Dreissena polymorpha]|uniref:Uncharacterized protein n=1 Tax=Dreissena polymorpha TaxID=45954 RepID=A0A9D4I838_DREPO|nr:hypothetical protein DPMN_184681 [Dreissena polymorpha]